VRARFRRRVQTWWRSLASLIRAMSKMPRTLQKNGGRYGPEYASAICTRAGNYIFGFRLGVSPRNLTVASFGAAVIFMWRPAALYRDTTPL
jgi:hypothetical protein